MVDTPWFFIIICRYMDGKNRKEYDLAGKKVMGGELKWKN
jgi:hypothetical protein